MTRAISASVRAVSFAALALALGCSHSSPYFRESPGTGADVGYDALAPLDHRLLLIGDAGKADPEGEPSLLLLAERAGEYPERTTLVFLGDNIYPDGLPSEPGAERSKALRRLEAQVESVRKSGARGIFVPGNHDWGDEGDGWVRVRAQGDYLSAVASAEGLEVALVPHGGCPGPVFHELGQRGRLISVDSHWWLEDGAKPQPGNDPTGCPQLRSEDVQSALLQQLDDAAIEGRAVVVAAHHPLQTRGPHGGFVDWRAHLFPGSEGRGTVPSFVEWIPFPVIGSAIVLARRCCSPSGQDWVNRDNRRMREALLGPMRAARVPPLAHAAGHDHSLQVLESADGPEYLLVSGLGTRTKQTRVGSDASTLFAHAPPRGAGFMQLDFRKDGSVWLTVLEPDSEGEARELYRRRLRAAPSPNTSASSGSDSAPRPQRFFFFFSLARFGFPSQPGSGSP